MLVGAVEKVEPEWDDEQRDMVTAYAELDRETGQFGENLMEATSALADPASKDAEYMYVAGNKVNGEWVPTINYAAKAAHEQMDRYYTRYPEAVDNRAYHIWPVQKIDLK